MLAGWKGEKLSEMLLLWSTEEIKEIECVFSDFVSASGKLSAGVAQARFVRYVMTDIFDQGCGYRQPDDFPSSLSPDMLDDIACFDLEAGTARQVWISISIPYSAAPGTYKGTLKVSARNTKVQTFDIELTVHNKTLPPPSEWAFHLDLWQHPAAVARVQGLTLWSDEHFEAMRPLYKLLANAGQKVITATLNKDPWNNQCFDRYDDMIVWTRGNDGSFSYDYTIFDKWIDFMMNEIGISAMINCYSLIPWNNEICYTDAKTGEKIDVAAVPGTKPFEELWKPFLLDFKNHLAEKGWLEITNIAMDERAPEVMEKAVAFLTSTAPELGISLADNHNSYKKYPFIRDISVSASVLVDSDDLKVRKENSLITTFYVCCSDKFPNMFTFSDPSESVYAAYHALSAGYDGFLRWAYNSWVENPLTDSRFRTWPAGDTYMVYPGSRSSMRFERLTEGIQDVEKIRILRDEAALDVNSVNAGNLLLLEKEISTFKTITPNEQPEEMIKRVKRLINLCSDI